MSAPNIPSEGVSVSSEGAPQVIGLPRRRGRDPTSAWYLVAGSAIFLVVLLVRNWASPLHMGDFTQYYMGAQIAAHHMWADLYPTPVPGSDVNPGHVRGSRSTPGYRRLADAVHVGDSWRFIQPPLVAFALRPLVWWPVDEARDHFVWFLGLCMAATIGIGAVIHRRIAPPAAWGPLVLLVVLALSPTALASARTGNVSPIVAAAIAVALLALTSPGKSTRRPATLDLTGYLALGVGTLVKYAPAALMPVFIIHRGWRAVVGLVGAFGLLAIASVWAAGWATNVQYLRLARAFGTPEAYDGNHALAATLVRLFHERELTPGQAVLFAAAKYLTLGALATLMLVRWAEIHRYAMLRLAACLGALTWFLIFSPIAHHHYHVYLFPLAGWCCEAARRCRWLAVPLCAALVCLYVPLFHTRWATAHLTVSVHMLWADLILLGVALVTLSATRLLLPPESVTAHPVNP